MKRTFVSILSIAALGFLAGCAVYEREPVAYGPPGAYGPPTVEVVPEYYAWDGVEYVGVVHGEYVYLGPGHVWQRMEPYRLQRFHAWERSHPDWSRNAIRNEQHAVENKQRNQEHAAAEQQRNQEHAAANQQRNAQRKLQTEQRNAQRKQQNEERNAQHQEQNQERNQEHQQP